jgi:hypothetical protein
VLGQIGFGDNGNDADSKELGLNPIVASTKCWYKNALLMMI